MTVVDAETPVSLLWPDPERRSTIRIPPDVATDLALDRVIQAINSTGRHERFIRDTLTNLPTEPDVILYRQEVLADIEMMPGLAEELRALEPQIGRLGQRDTTWRGESAIVQIIRRIGELDQYVQTVDRLNATLKRSTGIRSRGLARLRDAVAGFASEPHFIQLREELPRMQQVLGEVKSVTVGINLNPDLRPESATIVDINTFQFGGPRTLLDRLLPWGQETGRAGSTALRQVGPLGKNSPIYQDLETLLQTATEPLVQAIARYRDISARKLGAIQDEIAFYTGAAALFERLHAAGAVICQPEVAPTAERTCVVRDAANINLAIQMLSSPDMDLSRDLVTNDIELGSEARLLLITGPNRGGKTTYCRSIGQIQVLFQAGLYVLGSSARISPVDGIWTLFPLPENEEQGGGRLDEELERLRRIFDEATPYSLVLMNEPLTSTSERGALAIAIDVVRALLLLGARAVLVTHLHELARTIPELNAEQHGEVRSLIAVTETRDEVVSGTFKIVPGAPLGRSYSSEIARQHGLTFGQLQQLLAQRQVLGDPAAPAGQR